MLLLDFSLLVECQKMLCKEDTGSKEFSVKVNVIDLQVDIKKMVTCKMLHIPQTMQCTYMGWNFSPKLNSDLPVRVRSKILVWNFGICLNAAKKILILKIHLKFLNFGPWEAKISFRNVKYFIQAITRFYLGKATITRFELDKKPSEKYIFPSIFLCR